ncbi:hypothetical protein PWA39_00845 [Mesomycoplasma ovipneumoniae ATCC 29419]|uniref:hypothetical protein n=2 Tax=Mesomycoplasma ovipneumoniae TaxID=29562 RepID=UPI00237F5BEE|nr:hypothetical protein [Mesomycoplasma ovipneumoniae]WDV48824.1 hypothetical protein PWA39_00845 [Mesomycoplasma ovipneumoniae ATCC 29419]
MKQYKFTVEDKFKYIKIAESKGLKTQFWILQKNLEKFTKTNLKVKKADKEWMLHIYANNLIRNWQKKFYNNDMKSLISTRGKIKSPRKPKKKYTINDLSENDRGIYQEIVERVLKRSGIDPAIILEELKKLKQEQEKDKDKIENCTRICSVFNVNRTSIYEKIRVKKPPKKMIYDEDLLEWIRENFYLYRKVKGRDILYNIYINQEIM